ncbi:MAG: SpoIIE family protein phosphatase [Desulfobacterales bacterium]
MTRFQSFHLKNEMLAANFMANFASVFFVNKIMFQAEGHSQLVLWQAILEHPVAHWIDTFFSPLTFVLVAAATIIYEWPIRKSIDRIAAGEPLGDSDLAHTARRRLLNEPFVLIGFAMSMWILAAIIFPTLIWRLGGSAQVVQRAVYISLTNGLVAVTVAFFLMEHILQKRLAPLFFPEGGLSAVPGTLRIRIRMRLIALLCAGNLIPLFGMIKIIRYMPVNAPDPAEALVRIERAIYFYGFLFIAIGLFLTMLVSRNLSAPFREIIATLRRVRRGNFDTRVRVTSNDEIGYTGDAINAMTAGLRERERMQQHLEWAKEVQQLLLPQHAPQVAGLDITGRSIYCEETGGDYYDYLPLGNPAEARLGVVVGDVSGHGIPAALLMATARAFIRQCLTDRGGPNLAVQAVNRQLCRDVEDSGQFMTLFYCEIDHPRNQLRWVVAGHDPALLFDSQANRFETLDGKGLALGLLDTATYQTFQRDFAPGQVLILGTDGIWETQNARGQRFGKTRLKAAVRDNSGKSARHIARAVVTAVDQFRGGLPREDDLTLVVVKMV